MRRDAAQDEEIVENVYQVGRFQLPVDPDSQAFSGELIDDVEHPIFSSVTCAVFYEVIRPNMALDIQVAI